MSAGLRAAVEAQAAEWDELADRNEEARGFKTKVAGYYRRHSAQVRALLAAHPTPDQQPTADRIAAVLAEHWEFDAGSDDWRCICGDRLSFRTGSGADDIEATHRAHVAQAIAAALGGESA